MPFDNSEQQKTFDYINGKAFGVSYNGWSWLGAQQSKKAGPVAPPISGGKSSGGTINLDTQGAVPTVPLTKEEKARYKEHKASERDAGFAILVYLALAGALAYWDYTQGPVVEWYWHIPVVLVPPFLVVMALDRLKLLRFLRRVATLAVLVGIAAFAYGIYQSS